MAARSPVFWDVTPRGSLDVHRRFGRTFCLHLQCWRASQTTTQEEADGRNIGAAHSTETSANSRTAQCYILGEGAFPPIYILQPAPGSIKGGRCRKVMTVNSCSCWCETRNAHIILAENFIESSYLQIRDKICDSILDALWLIPHRGSIVTEKRNASWESADLHIPSPSEEKSVFCMPPVCLNVFISLSLTICLSARMYVCIDVYMYVCVCMYVCMWGCESC